MTFDRRRFFQSLTATAGMFTLSPPERAATLQGGELSKQICEEVPLQPDNRVPFPLRVADRKPCLWFDTFAQKAGDSAPSCEYLFQIPIGQFDQHGNPRSRLDTNMLTGGMMPGGFDAIVERIGFLFHPDTCDEDMIAASRWGRYEFHRQEKVVERGALDWAATGAQRGNPLQCEAKFIDIQRTYLPMYMYFNFSLLFQRPIVWRGDVRLLVFLDTLTDFPVS